FQTHLTFGEQRRVFRMIPGLENAEFLRYGVMHRNTYLNAPGLLTSDYGCKPLPNVSFAGQMTGVEGYVESCGSGFVAGTQMARRLLGLERLPLDDTTVLGAMGRYVEMGTNSKYQPMNANFGILAPLDRKVKGGKKYRNEAYAERALARIDEIIEKYYQ
ncbi:MAG: FAD-dependent oxidoreductase, partial [Clostridia bacterium]|nr:FAD-dependent oxidoreductase [Clostridia bacterium]